MANYTLILRKSMVVVVVRIAKLSVATDEVSTC